jgi:hypothetical protein
MRDRRNARARRRHGLFDLQWAFLNDEFSYGDDPANWGALPIDAWKMYFGTNPRSGSPVALELWDTYSADVLGRWAVRVPGTRPRLWWRFDAPGADAQTALSRFTLAGLPATVAPRRRTGGIGTPKHECLAYSPQFAFGIPTLWVNTREVEYYTGRAVDIHGDPIGLESVGRAFNGVPTNPDDPPRYESQAAYLLRHGLLLDGERSRLCASHFDEERVLPVTTATLAQIRC